MIINNNKFILTTVFIAITVLLTIPSCTKQYTDLGNSTEVKFIKLKLKGSNIVAIAQGIPFVDEGVSFIIDGKEDNTLKANVEGSVDINLPGLYIIKYSYPFKNNDSIPLAGSPIYRNVIVADPTANDNDLSGSYTRNSTFVISKWTKLMKGVYTVSEPGGAGGFDDFIVGVMQYDGNKIKIPKQKVPQIANGDAFDIESGSSGPYSFNPNAATGATAYIWAISTSGFGTQLRTFLK